MAGVLWTFELVVMYSSDEIVDCFETWARNQRSIHQRDLMSVMRCKKKRVDKLVNKRGAWFLGLLKRMTAWNPLHTMNAKRNPVSSITTT